MSAMDPRIRRATPGDAEGITRCHVGGWTVHYRGILPDDYLDALDVEDGARKRRRFLREEIEEREALEAAGADPRQERANWVLEEDGVIRGWASTGPARDDDLGRETNELYAIYVDPDLVGRGLGRALMTHCLEDAVERGFDAMVMWVLTGNERARRFYAAAGFEADPRVEAAAFRDTGQTKLRLWRRLGGHEAEAAGR